MRERASCVWEFLVAVWVVVERDLVVIVRVPAAHARRECIRGFEDIRYLFFKVCLQSKQNK